MFSYWYAEPNLSSFATFPLVHTGKTYQTKGATNRFLDWIENSESWRKDFDLWNYEMETAWGVVGGREVQGLWGADLRCMANGYQCPLKFWLRGGGFKE